MTSLDSKKPKNSFLAKKKVLWDRLTATAGIKYLNKEFSIKGQYRDLRNLGILNILVVFR